MFHFVFMVGKSAHESAMCSIRLDQ